MLWQIDERSTVPLFEQLASSARAALLSGELQAGERLPAARDLADSLGINIHTVLRAYQLLRDQGLIELRRGRGAIVLGQPTVSGRVQRMMDELVVEAQKAGIGVAELRAMLEGRA